MNSQVLKDLFLLVFESKGVINLRVKKDANYIELLSFDNGDKAYKLMAKMENFDAIMELLATDTTQVSYIKNDEIQIYIYDFDQYQISKILNLEQFDLVELTPEEESELGY